VLNTIILTLSFYNKRTIMHLYSLKQDERSYNGNVLYIMIS